MTIIEIKSNREEYESSHPSEIQSTCHNNIIKDLIDWSEKLNLNILYVNKKYFGVESYKFNRFYINSFIYIQVSCGSVCTVLYTHKAVL